jgi:hypothetical protein
MQWDQSLEAGTGWRNERHLGYAQQVSDTAANSFAGTGRVLFGFCVAHYLKTSPFERTRTHIRRMSMLFCPSQDEMPSPFLALHDSVESL